MDTPNSLTWRIALSCGVMVLVAIVALSLAAITAAVWLGLAG